MTERERALSGRLYKGYDDELRKGRDNCKDLCHEFNLCRPSDVTRQEELIRKIIGRVKGRFCITAPFWCDYGCNIEIGDNFYTNHNCVILDCAKITFGDNVFIAPNCCFAAATHPIDAEQRNAELELAFPITVGDNVWIGAGVTVAPGVTIGSGSVIGAGSVVVRDIPPNVVAVGNPCRVLRSITEKDKLTYTR